MTRKSTADQPQSKTKPAKPRPDFPLVAHNNGRWCKKINQKTHYFGRWDDPQAALLEYEEQRADLEAGRAPRKDTDATTLRQLVNAFLASKRAASDVGSISPRTFMDYHRLCGLLVDEFGATTAVLDIRPLDFERLYHKLAAAYSVVALAKMVTMTRSLFRYGTENELIDKTVKFGSTFKVPSKDEKRKERARRKQSNGKRMFEAAEVRAMLDGATPALKAMILLGANGGLGNTDCASLPLTAVDLDGGWLDYARVKTGVERRIPLWSETVEALRAVIATRRKPALPEDEDCLFVTKYGQKWVRYSISETMSHGKMKIAAKQDDAVSKETTKLLKTLGLKRPGLSFYSLRHGFETVAGGSKDQVAVDHIMGHIDSSMSEVYREGIDDSRLKAVTDHVHDWLFPPAGEHTPN